MGRALKEAGWTFLTTSIAIIFVTCLVGLVQNLTTSEFGNIYVNLWPLFVAPVVLATIFRFFLVLSPVQTLVFGLFSISIFFLIASDKTNPISISMREFVDKIFEINYLSLSFAIFAILIAVMSIFPRRHDE